MSLELRQAALDYHSLPTPGKLSINIDKPTESQRDLALAYTPGVAAPVLAIAQNPDDAYRYTSKGNLVGVISNGTAVLGLGNTGPLASKPVMEGKAVLFKRFANIDVFDIEVDANDPQLFIDTVAAIAPTFGGINLEDIKAPECFAIEQALIERLDIPVFHDDQHGTAIVVAAALINALQLQGKTLEQAKIVCLGAGAAGMASMHLLHVLGAKSQNLLMCDRQGVIYKDRPNLDETKARFAADTQARTVLDAMQGADVFIGVSGPNLVTGEMIARMASKPVVFALSNPDPEIHPDSVKALRDDVIMATGRSDFPNQVNNVLCFPYIFRGALDVRAKRISPEMLVAAVQAIRHVVMMPMPESVMQAYNLIEPLEFGPHYILPKPMDPRLKDIVASAVARAAIDSGVARLPYPAHYPDINQ